MSAKVVQSFKKAYKGFLHDILGLVIVAQHTSRKPKHAIRILLEQLAKGFG